MTAPLRVLHVIPSISPLRGGPSKAVQEMVQALCGQGVDASILTTNDHGPGLDPSLPTGRWIDRHGVPLIAFPRWSPPVQALREFAISPGLVQWLSSHIQRYDLLHVHAIFSFPSTWSMREARHAGIPYLVRTIGQLSPWSLSQSEGRKRWMLRLVEERNLQGAAALHYTTAAERDEARPLGLLPPALVLPLGVQLSVHQPRGANQSDAADRRLTRFLFLSRLHPKKQLERLLEALALVAQQRPQAAWELRIAGRGEASYEQQLRELSSQLGIASRCLWLGHVEGRLKDQELAAADWLVLPSAAENFGIAVVEGLAAGTPAILSPQVAVAEMVQAAGAGLVCESAPSQLASTLMLALGGPNGATREAARKLAAEHFAWPAIASSLASNYTSILDSSRGMRSAARLNKNRPTFKAIP
jgi:glycosyltransferase involved in cell wall biosynthesis